MRYLILALAFVLVACGAPKAATPDDAIAAFQAAGLEAEAATTMTATDYGMAPKVGTGKRFLVPSLCADCGGRVFAGKADELATLEAYYTSLGKQSAILYSHVYRHNGLLIQLNGSLPEDKAIRYKTALEGLK